MRGSCLQLIKDVVDKFFLTLALVGKRSTVGDFDHAQVVRGRHVDNCRNHTCEVTKMIFMLLLVVVIGKAMFFFSLNLSL